MVGPRALLLESFFIIFLIVLGVDNRKFSWARGIELLCVRSPVLWQSMYCMRSCVLVQNFKLDLLIFPCLNKELCYALCPVIWVFWNLL